MALVGPQPLALDRRRRMTGERLGIAASVAPVMGQKSKGEDTRRFTTARGHYRSRKSDPEAYPLISRRCLSCGEMFKSDLPVPVNRICRKCHDSQHRDNGIFGPGVCVINDGGWSSGDSED